jgi:hypothetical protein
MRVLKLYQNRGVSHEERRRPATGRRRSEYLWRAAAAATHNHGPTTTHWHNNY